MAKKRTYRKERLDRLRDKLANKTDLGGSSGFWSPKQGPNIIRILPEVGDMDYFFQEVGRHNFPDNKHVYCPSFTSAEDELDCPVCEIVQELYASGDKASRKLGSQLRVRKMYWMNVVIRDGENVQGPFIYTPGVTVFSSIAALIGDPDYGDIFDVDEGTDVTVEREGTGLQTEYQVIPRRYPSELPDAKDYTSKAKDLSYMEVSEDPEEDMELSDGHAVYVLPYDRIVDEHDLDMDIDDLIDGVEEDEHPARQEVTRRRRRRRR